MQKDEKVIHIFHLFSCQDFFPRKLKKYHQRLTEKGYDLERGIKGSNAKHQKTKELKKTTRYYENKVGTINKKLDNAMNEFEEKMKNVLDYIYL